MKQEQINERLSGLVMAESLGQAAAYNAVVGIHALANALKSERG